jgi:hypothetical protein
VADKLHRQLNIKPREKREKGVFTGQINETQKVICETLDGWVTLFWSKKKEEV